MSISRRSVLSYAAGAASAMALPSVTRAQAGPINLVFSHHVPITHGYHKAAEAFASRVKAQTNGQVTIDIKPAAQLFNLRTAAEALQLGTLDMCFADLGTLANWTPSLGFTGLPFLINDFDHAHRVLYGPIGKQVADLAKESLGIEILSFGGDGFRVFLSKKPIQKADDARAIRLRVPEVPTYVEMARAMGANPTPIPIAEVYTALQTGVVDAVELPTSYIVAARLFEVAGFATKTHHIFTEVSMMASAKRMATLPANVQKVIRDNAVQAIQTELWSANIKEQQDGWAELARRVKAFDAPDIASFRNKMGPVITNFIGKTGARGKAFVDAVQAAAKA